MSAGVSPGVQPHLAGTTVHSPFSNRLRRLFPPGAVPPPFLGTGSAPSLAVRSFFCSAEPPLLSCKRRIAGMRSGTAPLTRSAVVDDGEAVKVAECARRWRDGSRGTAGATTGSAASSAAAWACSESAMASKRARGAQSQEASGEECESTASLSAGREVDCLSSVHGRKGRAKDNKCEKRENDDGRRGTERGCDEGNAGKRCTR